MWLIKAEKYISEDMHVWPKKIVQVYKKSAMELLQIATA